MVSVAVATLFVGLTPPAQAGNFSGATYATAASCNVNMADNRDHFFWYSNITSPTQIAVAWSRANNLDPTEMNTYNESNGFSNSTDVVVYDEDYSGTFCNKTWIDDPNVMTNRLFAAVRCAYLTSVGKCDQYYVDFDNDFMGPRSAEAEAKLACHELGHTLGLMHRTMNTSCMIDPWDDNAANRYYDGHDRAHIPTI